MTRSASDDATETQRVRQTIIFEAARLLHEGRESDVATAKHRAARAAYRSFVGPSDFPTDAEVAAAVAAFEPAVASIDDRWSAYRHLLQPLARVQLPRRTHSESDALYHSLQVFSLAHDAIPYDEELLTAALLHDVGWAIDPRDPVEAGLAALDGLVSERTAWLIENLPAATAWQEGKLGTRAKNRLAGSDDRDELALLADCDRRGRVAGAPVPTLEEALEVLMELAGDETEPIDAR